MKYNSLNEIEKAGFTGFKTINQLMIDNSSIPDKIGIYLVLYIGDNTPNFSVPGSGGFFKRKDPNVPIETLQSNWVNKTLVLYIGKAGTSTGNATLLSRLKQYLKFGQGKNIGHYGGRYIWQVKDHQNLLICWKTTPNEDPRMIEKELIQDFVNQYHKRPFANLMG